MKKQSKEKESTFFEMFRKGGFHKTLFILSETLMKQKSFFDQLKEIDYMNDFYRVKPYLLEHELIKYGLDEQNEFTLALTSRGIELKKKILEIEELLLKP